MLLLARYGHRIVRCPCCLNLYRSRIDKRGMRRFMQEHLEWEKASRYPSRAVIINEGVRSRQADPTVYPKGLRVVQDGEHSPLSV